MPRRATTGARTLAVLIWAAHLLLLAMFLLLVLRLPPVPIGVPPGVILGAAVATSAAGVVLSRVVPPRIGARHATGARDALAMMRAIVGWALCEAVAMFPLVAFLLGRDARLLALFALDGLALAALFPTADRWAALGAGALEARGTRMVR